VQARVDLNRLIKESKGKEDEYSLNSKLRKENRERKKEE